MWVGKAKSFLHGLIKEDSIPDNAAFLGVLSLDGWIEPVDGMLPAIIAAKKEGFKLLYFPPMKDMPFPQIDDMEFCFVETLHDVIASFSGQLSSFALTSMSSSETTTPEPVTYDKGFQHILGHKQAKRAMEMAAAGGHNIFMTGPPGCGKSVLAQNFPSILPLLSETSQFDVMSIYQLAGIKNENYQILPFRDSHHSASAVSLIGGGTCKSGSALVSDVL